MKSKKRSNEPVNINERYWKLQKRASVLHVSFGVLAVIAVIVFAYYACSEPPSSRKNEAKWMSVIPFIVIFIWASLHNKKKLAKNEQKANHQEEL